MLVEKIFLIWFNHRLSFYQYDERYQYPLSWNQSPHSSVSSYYIVHAHTYDVWYICSNTHHVKTPATISLPLPLLSLYLLHSIILVFVSFRLNQYYIYLRTLLSPCNSLFSLKKLRGYLSILSFPLLVLTLIIGLVVLLLTLILKHALCIIVYITLSFLILHYNIPHFLFSITISIVFITTFHIILLLM